MNLYFFSDSNVLNMLKADLNKLKQIKMNIMIYCLTKKRKLLMYIMLEFYVFQGQIGAYTELSYP